MSLRGFLPALGFLLALVPAAAARAQGSGAPASASARVAPGQVVRWDGDGVERCGASGETWAPLDGACYYPVDLLRAEGPLPVERWRGGVHETATVTVTAPPYAVERLTVDRRKVELSKKDVARVQREAAAAAALFALRTPARFGSLPLSHPLAAAPPPRNFGTRRVFNGEPRSPHGGADFAAAAGTAVLAPAGGRVVLVADHFFSGRSVYLDHGDGLVSMSFHLSKTLVKTGAVVTRGQRIGLVGATGRSSGAHLHLGLRWRGARVDPAVLLRDPNALPRIVADGAPSRP